MKALRFIAFLLMVVGSLNWGLVGLFGYDLISNLFGEMSLFTRIIFGLVGLSGLYGINYLCRCCGCCNCGPKCKSRK
jgi:uncharacterized protein